ncbi:MAG: glucosamine-6-phosphate deaminase [Actinomycetota bacterium]|nr:glucosamine-6-phosphate deaminase [Actinomycetota bacterium]
MDIQVLQDPDELGRSAAEAVADKLRERPGSVILLPTGSTPLGMYRCLIDLHIEQDLSFSRATFFNLDEYLSLPPDHPASYRRYMEENFYCCVDADLDRVHVPNGSAPDPEAECGRYEEAIERAGGADLCVLGIGRNGHIGFNEPGAPFDSRTRVVRLAESTRRVNAEDFEGNRAPERALTVGMGTIFESKKILLLASGENKADAVAEAVEGPVTEEVPASVLQRHPNVTFLLDRAAASRLGKGAS